MNDHPILKWTEILDYLLRCYMTDAISKDELLKYLDALLTLRQIL